MTQTNPIYVTVRVPRQVHIVTQQARACFTAPPITLETNEIEVYMIAPDRTGVGFEWHFEAREASGR